MSWCPPLWWRLFLSTPSARRATDFDPDAAKEEIISIHALREEGDGQQRHGRHDPDAISIHALREEGDSVRTEIKEVQTIFLSTPSARRATGRWTGRPGGWKISIHALREEGDTFQPRCAPAAERFLSTPSARRATLVHAWSEKAKKISIHALREEGDRLPQ